MLISSFKVCQFLSDFIVIQTSTCQCNTDYDIQAYIHRTITQTWHVSILGRNQEKKNKIHEAERNQER